MATVFSSMSDATDSTSTFVVTGSTAAMRSSTPKRWHALSNAGWPVSGFTKFGWVMPRVSLAWSRYASTAWEIEPVPPLVTMPTGSASLTASAWNRSSAIAMISPSKRVALGHMSRWSTFTWANRPNALVRKS